MKLNYNEVWDDVVAMFKAQSDLVLVLAGALIFLPSLAQSWFVPPPEIKGFDLNAIKAMTEYYSDNALVLVACAIPVMLGTGALFALLLDSARLTVGEAIAKAARLLVAFFVLGLLIRIAIGVGLALLIVPGVYFAARSCLAEPAMMAEGQSNPLIALQRSFELTRGNGWLIVGISLIFIVATTVATSAASAIIGIAASLLLPVAGAKIVAKLLLAVSTCLMATIVAVLAAAIYRQLSGSPNKGI